MEKYTETCMFSCIFSILVPKGLLSVQYANVFHSYLVHNYILVPRPGAVNVHGLQKLLIRSASVQRHHSCFQRLKKDLLSFTLLAITW